MSDSAILLFYIENYAIFYIGETRVYRKIPYISPGLKEVGNPSLGGLYLGQLIFRGADIGRVFCVSVRV